MHGMLMVVTSNIVRWYPIMTFNGEIQDIVREKDTNQPEKGEDDGGGKSTIV